MEGTEYHIVDYTADKVEVSFIRTYSSGRGMVPLNIDKRYISYTIYGVQLVITHLRNGLSVYDSLIVLRKAWLDQLTNFLN